MASIPKIRAPLGELNAAAFPAAGPSMVKGAAAPVAPVAPVAPSSLCAHLDATLSPCNETRNAGIDALKELELQRGFCQSLLSTLRVGAGGAAAPLAQRLSAATYLKNFVKKHWEPAEGAELLPETERAEVRAQLLQTLLAIDVSELRNMLAEVLRLVATTDYPARWPALVPALKAQITAEALPEDTTLHNVIVAAHVLTRPFEHFRSPTVAREEAPPELELLATELLQPLMERVLAPRVAQGAAASDDDDRQCDMLRLVVKTFFRITKCYMPKGLEAHVGGWLNTLLAVLRPNLCPDDDDDDDDEDDDDDDDDESLSARWKLQKRALQTLLNFQDRHRKLYDGAAVAAAKLLVSAVQQQAAGARKPLPDRVLALCFDALSRSAEHGTHQKLVLPHLGRLLEKAVFPAVCLSAADRELWFEDEEEYLARNLDVADGLHEEHFTARRSALSFVEVLASVVPQQSGGSGGAAPKKGKGKGNKSKGKRGPQGGTPFDAIMKFADSVLVACASADAASFETQSRHSGALMIYAASADAMKARGAAEVSKLLQKHVLPVCSAQATGWPGATPLLAANAQFVLAQFSSFLPAERKTEAFESALANMLELDKDDDDSGSDSDDGGDDGDDDDEVGTLKVVRVSSANTVRSLLEAQQFEKEELVGELERLVTLLLRAAEAESGAGSCNDLPLAILQQLISLVDEEILPHVAPIVERLVDRLNEQIDEQEDISDSSALELFSSIVESLSTIEAEAEAEAEEEEDEDAADDAADAALTPMQETAAWMCAQIRPLLQKLWLRTEEGEEEGEEDTTVYLPETAQLLQYALEHTDMQSAESEHTWSLVHLFAFRLQTWAKQMECEDAEDAWQLCHAVIVHGGHSETFAAAPEGQCSVQDFVISAALHVIESSGSKTARFGCRLVRGCFIAQRQPLPVATLQKIVAVVSNELVCEPTPLLQQELVLLLCFAYFHRPKLVTTVMADAAGGLAEFSRALSELKPDDVDVQGASAKVLVMAGMQLVQQLNAESGSSESRRQLRGCMDVVVSQVMQQAEAAAEEEEQEEEEEEEDEEDEEEEEDEEDEGEDEDVEDEDVEEGDSDDDESEEEEEVEEESEEAMMERYAEIARKMESGDMSDDEDEDAEEELDIEDNVEDAFGDVNAVEHFVLWFQANSATAEDLTKRSTLALLKAAFKSLA